MFSSLFFLDPAHDLTFEENQFAAGPRPEDWQPLGDEAVSYGPGRAAKHGRRLTNVYGSPEPGQSGCAGATLGQPPFVRPRARLRAVLP